MLHLASGISFISLFVNLILAPVPPSPSHLFLHPPRLPRLIHHFVHLWLHLSFTPGLKRTSFTNPTPLVSVLPPGLPPRTFACTVSPELLGFWFLFFPLFFDSGPCARLSWPSRQLLSARKSTVSYRIVYLCFGLIIIFCLSLTKNSFAICYL